MMAALQMQAMPETPLQRATVGQLGMVIPVEML
jgi:hypothetical protein